VKVKHIFLARHLNTLKSIWIVVLSTLKRGIYVTAGVTYLINSNTEVTSLLSGTAIKAVVAYVSDYISKPSLKTYPIFEAVKIVFHRNSEMFGESLDQK
jgi:hypothetical protein